MALIFLLVFAWSTGLAIILHIYIWFGTFISHGLAYGLSQFAMKLPQDASPFKDENNDDPTTSDLTTFRNHLIK